MVNLCLLHLHDLCGSVWHVHGTRRGGESFPRGKWEFQLTAGGWWSRIAEAGVAAVILGLIEPVQHCPSSVPVGQWPLSSASFPSICGVPWSCPLPQAVWAVCLGTPQCEMILICSWQSRGACLQPGRLFCQGLRFQTFDFGGLNRKHFTVCGCWVWHQLLCSHKCWHTSFRLSVIPQAVLYILPGGTRSTLLGELKAKKEWMKISEIPSPALAFLLGWQE